VSVIKGSEIEPDRFRSPIAQKNINAGISEEQQRIHDRAFELWKQFSITDQGQTCERLAEPRIKEIERKLCLSVREFMDEEKTLTLEFVNERRAELRGERRVWLSILYEQEILKNQLESLGKIG
tara:strand:+ start:40 stop:411 length:372 start_codon:yes stop_codon:yes gene_type:complete